MTDIDEDSDWDIDTAFDNSYADLAVATSAAFRTNGPAAGRALVDAAMAWTPPDPATTADLAAEVAAALGSPVVHPNPLNPSEFVVSVGPPIDSPMFASLQPHPLAPPPPPTFDRTAFTADVPEDIRTRLINSLSVRHHMARGLVAKLGREVVRDAMRLLRVKVPTATSLPSNSLVAATVTAMIGKPVVARQPGSDGTPATYKVSLQPLGSPMLGSSQPIALPPLTAEQLQKLAAVSTRLKLTGLARLVRLRSLIAIVGAPLVEQTTTEAEQIATSGGLTLPNGTLKRFASGIFFHLIRTRITPEQRAAIY